MSELTATSMHCPLKAHTYPLAGRGETWENASHRAVHVRLHVPWGTFEDLIWRCNQNPPLIIASFPSTLLEAPEDLSRIFIVIHSNSNLTEKVKQGPNTPTCKTKTLSIWENLPPQRRKSLQDIWPHCNTLRAIHVRTRFPCKLARDMSKTRFCADQKVDSSFIFANQETSQHRCPQTTSVPDKLRA